MKCLIINGSPHKGNTWKIVELVKNNIQFLSKDIVFEEIHLNNVNLPLCTGCSLCFRKGHIYCPHNNVLKSIFDKIDECDALIFASTTFNMQPTALTKNLVDHMCFMLHRPRYFNKKALVISTAGGVGASSTTKYLSGTLKAIGFNCCYQLPFTSFSWNDYQPKQKTIEKCNRISKTFCNDLISKRIHKPTFTVLMPYNLFRGMSKGYMPGTKYETQDGVFWGEEERAKKAYASEIKLPFYKKWFGHLFYFIGSMASKYIIVTYRKST